MRKLSKTEKNYALIRERLYRRFEMNDLVLAGHKFQICCKVGFKKTVPI